MLEKNLTERVLLKASESGADFAEILPRNCVILPLRPGPAKLTVCLRGCGWVPEYGFLRVISAVMPIPTISAKRD